MFTPDCQCHANFTVVAGQPACDQCGQPWRHLSQEETAERQRLLAEYKDRRRFYQDGFERYLRSLRDDRVLHRG